MTSRIYVVGVLLGAALSGCQTDSSTGRPVTSNPFAVSQGLFDKSYHLFFSPADHVNELLAQGEIEKASQVWSQQSAFFTGNGSDGAKKATRDLSVAVYNWLSPRMDVERRRLDNIVWPVSRDAWPQAKASIAEAQALKAEIDGHKVLLAEGPIADRHARFLVELEARTAAIRSSAKMNFRVDDETFFASYPLALEPRSVLAESMEDWSAALRKASPATILAFYERYKEFLSDDAGKELGRLHYRSTLAALPGRGFGRAMSALTDTRAAGLPIERVDDANIRIVDISNASLIQDGQIEFPLAVGNDLPFQVDKAQLDTAFEGPASKGAEVLVLVDVALARNDRKISAYDAVGSEFRSDTRFEPNPDYPLAEAAVLKAQMDLYAAQRRSDYDLARCSGWACLAIGVLHAAAIGQAESDVTTARSRLSSTSASVSVPVYKPYSFNRASIDAAKIGTINYYVIDKAERAYVRGTVDVRETKSFVVAYGLHAEDRNRSSQLSATSKEEAVVAFEKEAVTVPLSRIVAELTQLKGERKPLPALVDIRKEISAGKLKAVAALKSRTYDATPGTADRRFDNVVVVRHPGGSIGSGFFVRDDVVVTNYHVIRGSQFVELKLRNGAETFGKVVAQDIRLDLALIKTQARGTPVSFFGDRSLPLGQAVDAIGHPRNLQFSITRGVISGVRDISSSYAPGGRKVKFIQTDTALNPGNSGGPLFLGDKVIGVVTQKLAAAELEGLSFAIHYGEVLDFLEASDRAVRAGS